MRHNVSTELKTLTSQMLNSGIGYEEAMGRFESAYFNAAVTRCDGHYSRAAALLGVHRNTVTRILARTRKWFIVATLSAGKIAPRQQVSAEDEAILNEREL